MDDGERREAPAGGECGERVEHPADLDVPVRVDLGAEERVDRVEHDERNRVLDDDPLEQLVLVGDRDPSGERPGPIKTAKAAKICLGVLEGFLATLTARFAIRTPGIRWRSWRS